MVELLYHRGPDDSGTWFDPSVALAMGHRRLSILDLTEAGHQPMVSGSGRYVLVFNGEIYNHVALREMLGVDLWHGHSDTETLLACIEGWGLDKTLRRCVGMFAIALWDRDAQELSLVRDRFGEKPLYYGWVRGALVFASELKTIRAFPGFDNDIERRALALFMRHNCVPSPWTIYKNIWKLPPACGVKFSARKLLSGERGLVQTYWSASEMTWGRADGFSGSDAEAVDELQRVLCQSIAGQMIADVPLGAFLSGGIDSSTVVAIMQSLSSRPVRTFTIGFHEGGYNEARHALGVARHLGTDHTELYVSPSEALDVIPRLPEIYDEPFADSSQIPTFLIAQLASAHVTVALSGDGGDELFGGYNRHLWAPRLWGHGGLLPASLRRVCAEGMTVIPPHGWNRIFAMLGPLLPASLRYGDLGDKIHKLAGVLGASDPGDLYLRCVSHWPDPARVVLGAEEPLTSVTDCGAMSRWPDYVRRMMYLDLTTYLPDDILTKLDRAAMAVSLETRVPFLDHRVVEFAWSLPLGMKIRNGQGKWALRQVLFKHVPKELVERPKTGFAIPLGSWLRGPLRAWAENLLDENRLRCDGYFDPAPIRRAWAEHLSGRRNRQYLLWDVLMFQAWLDRWK